MKRALCWLIACATAGCAHLAPSVMRAPLPVPDEIAAYYTYPKRPIEPSVELAETRQDYTVEMVRWPLVPPPVVVPHGGTARPLGRAVAEGDTTGGGMAMEPPVEGEDATIEVEWYESLQPGKRAALLVLPILGGDYPIERAFCRFFASRGLHCALVHRRTLKFTATESPDDLEALLRLSVIRHRQVLDWLETQPSVDASRLGLFGISMGAITGVVTAAVDARIQALVAGLAGGSVADMLRDTHDPMLTKPRQRYLAAHAITLEELHRRLTEAIRTDPLRLAPEVDGARVLCIMARFDRTITYRHSRRLWEALGRPEVLMLPLGHYSSLLATPYVQTQSLRFFRRALGLPPTVTPRRHNWRGPGPHGIMEAVPRIVP